MRNLNPLYLQEGVVGFMLKPRNPLGKVGILTRAGTVAAHFGNNLLIVRKVLSAFPTPDSLKNYLMRSGDMNARKIGEVMDPNMDYMDYKNFIKRYFTKKFNLLNLISGRIGLAIQGGKAIKNAVTDGDQIVNSAISDGRFAQG